MFRVNGGCLENEKKLENADFRFFSRDLGILTGRIFMQILGRYSITHVEMQVERLSNFKCLAAKHATFHIQLKHVFFFFTCPRLDENDGI